MVSMPGANIAVDMERRPDAAEGLAAIGAGQESMPRDRPAPVAREVQYVARDLFTLGVSVGVRCGVPVERRSESQLA